MRITLGAKEKKERRIGERLGVKGDRSEGPKAAVVRRKYPPGVHGAKRHARLTPYGLQLREKQKAQITYGLSERQLRNYFKKASAKKGDTELMFGQLLETRLDNVVYRFGFARSRSEARQVVSHAHFKVNGKRMNIPSYQARVGDTVELKPKSSDNKHFKEVMLPRLAKHNLPKWLARKESEFKGQVISFPEGDSLPDNIDRKMIIEFYSR